MGKKQFCFFQTAETGNRTPDSGVKGSGANHYPRAPALSELEAGTNCYERKQDIQQWPPSPKNKNKCSMVNKLHPVVLQSRPINYTSGTENILHEL